MRRIAEGRKVRYISAGRMSPLENFRSNYDGRRGDTPNYDNASFGGKDYRQYRHQSETIYGDFHTLSIRKDIQIKVIERLRTLFKRDMFLDWDAGNLRVRFNRLDIEGSDYSLAREASGLLQLVAILAALYDDEVGILLLDEPEISLHPQLQSFLLKEILHMSGEISNRSKKMIVVSTHSTELFKLRSASDLENIVFFRDVKNTPIQIPINAGELRNKKIKELIPRLSYSHKIAMFSKKPLLVEGISDSIVLNFVDDFLSKNISTAGSQIIPVVGKGQIPVVFKLMKLLGKDPIILTDLDSIADGLDIINLYNTNNDVNNLVAELGHSTIMAFARNVYNDFCSHIDNHWDDLSNYSEKHNYWINKDSSVEVVVSKRRAGLATIFNLKDIEMRKLNNSDKWSSIRLRFRGLIDILEKVGCFILRKGTIEDYYYTTPNLNNGNKTAFAVEETEFIIENNPTDFQNKYSDVIRSLEYAAKQENIDESNQVRDLVLQVISPILSSLSKINSTSDLTIKANQILKSDSELFDFNLIKEDSRKSVEIKLKSTLLQVEGFPIIFSIDENPIITANKIKMLI
jgi:hypothetical protein